MIFCLITYSFRHVDIIIHRQYFYFTSANISINQSLCGFIGKESVIQLLLRNKANRYIKDKNGKLPIDLAISTKGKDSLMNSLQRKITSAENLNIEFSQVTRRLWIYFWTELLVKVTIKRKVIRSLLHRLAVDRYKSQTLVKANIS